MRVLDYERFLQNFVVKSNKVAGADDDVTKSAVLRFFMNRSLSFAVNAQRFRRTEYLKITTERTGSLLHVRLFAPRTIYRKRKSQNWLPKFARSIQILSFRYKTPIKETPINFHQRLFITYFGRERCSFGRSMTNPVHFWRRLNPSDKGGNSSNWSGFTPQVVKIWPRSFGLSFF